MHHTIKCGHALFRLAFALPSQVVLLKRQRRLTRRLILQKARRHTATLKRGHGAPTACRRHGFSYSFTPLPGCFSPFPHGTCSLSVAKEYLALRGGPRGFRPGFPCPAVLRYLS